MALNNPIPGFNNTAEYIPSGIPFVFNKTTPGTSHIKFHHVTRTITVAAIVSSSQLTFSDAATIDTTFEIPAGSVVELPIRVREMWLSTSGSASVIAGLTLISTSSMPLLSGWGGI